MRAKGIDISMWQKTFEPKGNIDFVIQKVSEGTVKDSLYNQLLPGVKTIELRGGYHYFRTEIDPIQQAEFFFKAQAGQGFKFLAVDYERHNNNLDAIGEAKLGLFWDHLHSLTDKPILLYTSPYIYRDNLCAHNNYWKGVPLWMAHYSGKDPENASPYVFEGSGWILWQFSNTGMGIKYGVGSVNVDLNVFNGTVEEMKAMFIKENEMKKWYLSKIVWASISATVVGLIDIVSDFLAGGVYDSQSIFLAAIGLFTLISRIWFTTKSLEP